MKKHTVKKKKRMINAHAWVLAVISFILALTVGEIVVAVFQYFNNINHIADDALLITQYIIPALSAVCVCVVIYINHRSLQTSNKLIEGLNKVASGDYNAKIPYRSLDGFNAVYENFNKMTDELKSVKALREDFVHDFSHEFKTPIASINGFANLLLEGGLTAEEERKIIAVIADESARLSKLSETVLTLSRLESQQFIGESKTYRLDVQLKDCIVLLQRDWEKKELNISTELGPVTYTGDEDMIKQVWLNLLSNAIKFTPAGGDIAITLSAADGRAKVCIADSGTGIPEDALNKVFDKYYQVTPGNGNGLGLAICKRICTLAGGEISVSSRLGAGSKFTVVL